MATLAPETNTKALTNLHIVVLSVSSLSLVCCTFVMVTYALLPRLRRHPSQLLFFRTVCDFLLAGLGIGMSVWRLVKTERCSDCLVPSMIFQFSTFASSAWYVILAIDLLLAIRNPFSAHKEYNRYYHFLVWTTSILTAGVLVIGQYQGNNKFGLCWFDDGQCFVDTSHVNSTSGEYFYVGVGLYFGPFFLLNIIAVSILVFAFAVLRKGLPDSDVLRQRVLQHSTVYVLAFAIQWFIFLALWVADFFIQRQNVNDVSANDVSTTLATAASAVLGINGLLDFIVWMWTGRIQCAEMRRRVSTTRRQRACSEIESMVEGKPSREPLIVSPMAQQDVSAGLRRDAMRCVSWGILDTVSVNAANDDLNESVYDVIRRQKLRPRGHTCVFEFRDFAPDAFHRLRAAQNIQWSDYSRSFQDLDKLEDRELLEKFTDGRSGSFFYFSLDSKYIVKTVSKGELFFLRSILPRYVDYLERNPNSLLTRVYGLHRVRLAREQVVISLAVMGNIFPPSDRVKVTEKYDLKGSSIDRRVLKPGSKSPSGGVTLKDNDLNKTFVIGPEKKSELMSQLRSDVAFLAQIGVMDYSLLVGISESQMTSNSSSDAISSTPQNDSLKMKSVSSDESILEQNVPRHMRRKKQQQQQRRSPATHSIQKSRAPSHLVASTESYVSIFMRDDGGVKSVDGKRTYYFGLIDVLQRYTCSKKMEHFLKANCLCKNGEEISAVDVDLYARRFIERMNDHFE